MKGKHVNVSTLVDESLRKDVFSSSDEISKEGGQSKKQVKMCVNVLLHL